MNHFKMLYAIREAYPNGLPSRVDKIWFADSHDVIVEEVRGGKEETEYPAFVDGARRCPPEDVGGTHGFMEFLEAVLDPGHEDHGRMTEWYGGPFDPEDIEEQEVRLVLGIYAGCRRGSLVSHRSGKRGGSRKP